MTFGHFIYFGHFPIEIPIEAEKIYHHGKELSYRENKMCSETSEAVGTIWEHAQKEFQKFLKIRITLLYGQLFVIFFVFFFLDYDSMCSEMDFTPEKSFSSNYKNSQLLLTAAAALSQNGQIAV